jgi:hypothetical protein
MKEILFYKVADILVWKHKMVLTLYPMIALWYVLCDMIYAITVLSEIRVKLVMLQLLETGKREKLVSDHYWTKHGRKIHVHKTG